MEYVISPSLKRASQSKPPYQETLSAIDVNPKLSEEREELLERLEHWKGTTKAEDGQLSEYALPHILDMLASYRAAERFPAPFSMPDTDADSRRPIESFLEYTLHDRPRTYLR